MSHYRFQYELEKEILDFSYSTEKFNLVLPVQAGDGKTTMSKKIITKMFPQGKTGYTNVYLASTNNETNEFYFKTNEYIKEKQLKDLIVINAKANEHKYIKDIVDFLSAIDIKQEIVEELKHKLSYFY